MAERLGFEPRPNVLETLMLNRYTIALFLKVCCYAKEQYGLTLSGVPFYYPRRYDIQHIRLLSLYIFLYITTFTRLNRNVEFVCWRRRLALRFTH